MAFKLTYSDGQESQHDDDTVWDLDDGVLKLGRKKGEWSVLLSPSHWAVLEFVGTSSKDDDSDDDDDKSDDDKSDDKKNSDKSDDDKKDSDKKDDD
ncbi:hypothetical protein [Mycobacterium sp. SMC-4]|uniref:hypothetical protein n=1 Tax=Mycobacterium sp. SMC-4 TaxID=2857059 RepID=UPI003D07AC2F